MVLEFVLWKSAKIIKTMEKMVAFLMVIFHRHLLNFLWL